MRVRIGPIEIQVNAFLVLLGLSLEALRQLSTNEKFKAKLQEETAKAKAKKQEQQGMNIARMFGADASGTPFSSGSADEIISQMFPNKRKPKNA